jgi:hypothetical protein
MLIEVTRLAVGLLIALFHEPLADFILAQDRAMSAIARRRGLSLPELFSARGGRNFYFAVGIFVALYELLRIWTMLR